MKIWQNDPGDTVPDWVKIHQMGPRELTGEFVLSVSAGLVVIRVGDFVARYPGMKIVGKATEAELIDCAACISTQFGHQQFAQRVSDHIANPNDGETARALFPDRFEEAF